MHFTRSSVYPRAAKTLSFTIFFALILAALINPYWRVFSMRSPEMRTADARGAAVSDDAAATSRATDAYGRLPLSFEANHGQTDPHVLFLTRAQGYGLYLTADGAVFSFNGLPAPLRMRLQGAANTTRVSGLDELQGKVNYLIGNKTERWRTNIPTYARVRYEQIYPGVDLVYYGNQRQLEYDFVVAPNASFKQIRLAFEGAAKLKLNRRGDLVWQTGPHKVTLLRPHAYQEIDGNRRAIAAGYTVNANGQIAFQVGHYDRTQPLVIDPILSYSTYLGGSSQDVAQSIAVDSSGNAYITGQTFSSNFPTIPQLFPNVSDAFVTKLNATGTAVVYSTLLGGSGSDIGTNIACDAAGSAYIVGQTTSTDFPVFAALHPTFGGVADAFVVQLNASGSAPVFSTFLGGRARDAATSVAVDNGGNAYITGTTGSPDFPTTNPLQDSRAGNTIFKTTNAAADWTMSDSGLLAGSVLDLVFNPANPSIMYAATDIGIYKTTDAGLNWNALGGQPTLPINKLAIDPSNPNIIYVAGLTGMSKSIDGGNSFTAINNGLNTLFARAVAIDPVTPTTLYASSISNIVYKSIDGGANWTESFINTVNTVNGLLIDPNTPATIYAATNRGVFKSTNSAVSWASSNTGFPFSSIAINSLAIDQINNLLYAATSNSGIFKSVNAGGNWTNISSSLPPFSVSLVTPDPSNASIIYAVSNSVVFKTVDAGVTWTQSNNGIPNTGASALLLSPVQPGTLYLASSSATDAFVTKLSTGGASQIYSTYLGGSIGDAGNGIAIDSSGNAYVVGTTSSTNFPTANAIQPARDPNSLDAFVTKLNASGSALVYSTFLGGNSNDTAAAVAVDNSGNAYVTGTTLSQNFPTANAFQATNPSFSNKAFVTKINAAGSALVYSTYLGGSFNDDGVDIAVDAAGSAYVVGTTNSINFPVAGALQPTLSGASDAFVTKFAPNGMSLVYSTYLGGTSTESGLGLALDSANNAYVVGSTTSTNFPILNPLQANYRGNTDAFIAKLSSAPDMAVTITDSPDPVNHGADLTYTINVVNNGDIPATGVTVTDALPAGATFVSVNSTVGSCNATSTITCTLGTFNPNAAATVTLVIRPPAVRTVSNTVNLTLNEPDSFIPNNSATTQTLVDFADLSIIKNAAQSLVAPGGKLTYSLIVKNKGVIPAVVTVTDNLPAGTSLVQCAATGSAVCGGSGNNVSVQIPSLAPEASEAVLLTVGVSASATAATVIGNTASVSSPLPDPDTSNNSSTANVTVANIPVLQKSNGIIAFESDRNISPGGQPSGIYTIKADGTGEVQVPNTPLNARWPSWSPDGTRLAFIFTNFSGPSSPVNQLDILNADGTGRAKIAENISDFNRSITWSPNGTQIAFIGVGQQGIASIRAVRIANADGSGSYQLPNSPTFLSSVDWSPDGSKFLYADDKEIFVMNADGTGQTQLTTSQQTNDGATIDTDPHWSPDGTKIILTRSTINSHAIYTMNANGSNLAKLFNFGGQQADWSPDGVSVVFHQTNEICTANTDGTNFKCLTNNNFFDFAPKWQKVANASPTPTPTPSPAFSISGKITLSDGSPLSLQVQLTGPASATGGSNNTGNYSFVNLPAGQYTLTPLSIFHSFNPPSSTVTISNANLTGMDFVATFVPANISGHVRDNNGNPLSGIKVTAGGSAPQGSMFTDANGFYSFPNVPRHATYSVFADPFTPYTFAPDAMVISDLTASVTIDFVGTKQPSNTMAGRVVEAISGQGLSGIQVSLAQDNAAAAFVFTDANGNYTFGERKSNHAYSVSIAPHPTFIFEPTVNAPTPFAEFDIASLTTNQNLIFRGRRRNTVQFSATSPSVPENSGSREIVITRTGDVASAATVNYATSDAAGLVACTVVNGNASERCDYETAVGTLRFAAGETSKSFLVPIVDDGHVEGNETFTLTLSGAVGASINSPASTTVTITDNDAASGTQNPIDGVQFFVTQQYIDFLGRLPDSIGLANWMATLNGCPNAGFGENDNPDCDRVHVSAGFFLSDEFRGRGYWAYRFYEVGFDRRPLYAQFVPDMAQVGGAQSPASELLSKAAYTEAFVQRIEFTNRYNALSNSAYVNALEQNAEITLSNKPALVAALDNNQKMRGDVLREIIESKDVEDRFFIRAFVAMQYFGYLRRDPDTIGYNNWVTTLTADPSNFRHMIFGFLFSTEYRGRFGNN
jgi:uncharacterized repeat protein (TIGR01451 family)